MIKHKQAECHIYASYCVPTNRKTGYDCVPRKSASAYNLTSALSSLQTISFEGFEYNMYDMMDAEGGFSALFFIFTIIIGFYVLVSILVAGITNVFTKVQRDLKVGTSLQPSHETFLTAPHMYHRLSSVQCSHFASSKQHATTTVRWSRPIGKLIHQACQSCQGQVMDLCAFMARQAQHHLETKRLTRQATGAGLPARAVYPIDNM